MHKPSPPRRLLKEVIQAYRAGKGEKLQRPDHELLARLAKDTDAAQAFARLRLKDPASEAILLDACIAANHIHLNFRKLLEEQRNVLERVKRWEQAALVLQNFYAEMANPQHSPILDLAGLDLWPTSLSSPPVTDNDLKRALDSIAKTIRWRRYVAEQNVANLGATRDRHTTEAAKNSAIWILSAGVYNAARNRPLPGKPHIWEVVLLARTILQTDTITPDRVRLLNRRRLALWLQEFGKQPNIFD